MYQFVYITIITIINIALILVILFTVSILYFVGFKKKQLMKQKAILYIKYVLLSKS